MVRAFFLLLPIVFLSACDSSSSSKDGPTDPNQLFSLVVLKSGAIGDVVDEKFVSGSVQTLQGSYSASGSYKLSWITPDTAFSGSAFVAQQHYAFLSYRTDLGQFTGDGVRYNIDLDMNGFALGIRDADANITCTPISTIYALPDSAKIGDGGLYLDNTCSDPSKKIKTNTVTWGITDALAGNVYFVLTVTNRDASSIVDEAVFKAKLNGAGNVVGLQVSAQNNILKLEAASRGL